MLQGIIYKVTAKDLSLFEFLLCVYEKNKTIWTLWATEGWYKLESNY